MSHDPQEHSPETPEEVPQTDQPDPKRLGDDEEIDLLHGDDGDKP